MIDEEYQDHIAQGLPDLSQTNGLWTCGKLVALLWLSHLAKWNANLALIQLPHGLTTDRLDLDLRIRHITNCIIKAGQVAALHCEIAWLGFRLATFNLQHPGIPLTCKERMRWVKAVRQQDKLHEAQDLQSESQEMQRAVTETQRVRNRPSTYYRILCYREYTLDQQQPTHYKQIDQPQELNDEKIVQKLEGRGNEAHATNQQQIMREGQIDVQHESEHEPKTQVDKAEEHRNDQNSKKRKLQAMMGPEQTEQVRRKCWPGWVRRASF